MLTRWPTSAILLMQAREEKVSSLRQLGNNRMALHHSRQSPKREAPVAVAPPPKRAKPAAPTIRPPPANPKKRKIELPIFGEPIENPKWSTAVRKKIPVGFTRARQDELQMEEETHPNFNQDITEILEKMGQYEKDIGHAVKVRVVVNFSTKPT